MALKELDSQIKDFYNSVYDNLVDDFYNVVLANTKNYDRLSGYFRSNSLAIAAKGISQLIENNGHMRLLCGAQLTKEDVNSIKNADDLKDIIDKNFLGDYENLEDNLIKKHVQLLGWMVANGFLEIKIGINTNGDEYHLDGMLHTKKGIFYDENDDFIMFMGSINETVPGWAVNFEEFSVDKSWEGKDLSKPIMDFENMWNGKFPNLLVLDVPEASKRKLIEDAPSDWESAKKIIYEINGINVDERKPFFYQRNAIDNWFDNGKKGIFEMATGTGKTFTALSCLKRVLEEEEVLTVIACPYIHLIEQWKIEIEKLDLGLVHEFYGSSNSSWGAEFDRLKLIIKHASKTRNHHIILTSHDTFSSDDFIEKLDGITQKLLLIVDEVHHVGASGLSKGLDSRYNYRLGLSATPERYMDYRGTDKIKFYFNDVVFEFDIMDALSIRNFEKDNEYFLTPYDYIPIKVKLTYEESKNKSKANNARHKYVILREILDNLKKPINHLIIFCSNKQLGSVLKILKEKNIKKHEFTYRQDLNLRMKLLDEFDKGEYQALVAMRCLNEGVDVPSTDKVIIMSSSPNPAENIQRRGRVLRRAIGKDKAYIYDLVVIPDKNNKILEDFRNSELDRLIEFINTSDNEEEGKTFLENMGVNYG